MNNIELTTQFEQFCKSKAPLIATKSENIRTVTELPQELTRIIASFSPFFPIAEGEEEACSTQIITWVTGEAREEISNNFALMKEVDGLQEQTEQLMGNQTVDVRAVIQRLGIVAKKALFRKVPELAKADQEAKLLSSIQSNLLGRIEDDIAAWNKSNPNIVCAITEEYLFSTEKP